MLSFKYPNEDDQLAVEEFIGNEILLAGILLSAGDIKNAVEHLANTVLFTRHNERILYTLLTTLPDHIFRMIIETLPETKIVRSSCFMTPTIFDLFFCYFKRKLTIGKRKKLEQQQKQQKQQFLLIQLAAPVSIQMSTNKRIRPSR